jgi:hypothetical protein
MIDGPFLMKQFANMHEHKIDGRKGYGRELEWLHLQVIRFVLCHDSTELSAATCSGLGDYNNGQDV